ncbi:hypothetical protein D3C78_1558850 [compost metagenome]
MNENKITSDLLRGHTDTMILRLLSEAAFTTVSFDGAIMDKLTYAALKGLWVIDLLKVTVI